LKKLIRAKVKSWNKVSTKSVSTRFDFHNKLAVLSAGSIAVVASGAVAILSLRTAHPLVGSHSFRGIALASLSLFLSLICCIIHNYIETRVQAREGKAYMQDSLLSMLDLVFMERKTTQLEKTKVLEATSFKKDHEKFVNGNLKIRETQLMVSLGAVVFFVIGYGAVVWLIWVEATLL
jgi:hypothetical protein